MVLGEWKRFYSFEHYSADEPRVRSVDFEVPNFYISTFPVGLFAEQRFATKPYEGGRATLIGNDLKLRRAGDVAPETRAVVGDEDMQGTLREHFGLELTLEEAGFVFRANAEGLNSFSATP